MNFIIIASLHMWKFRCDHGKCLAVSILSSSFVSVIIQRAYQKSIMVSFHDLIFDSTQPLPVPQYDDV
jgi:hypothetical protein